MLLSFVFGLNVSIYFIGDFHSSLSFNLIFRFSFNYRRCRFSFRLQQQQQQHSNTQTILVITIKEKQHKMTTCNVSSIRRTYWCLQCPELLRVVLVLLLVLVSHTQIVLVSHHGSSEVRLYSDLEE